MDVLTPRLPPHGSYQTYLSHSRSSGRGHAAGGAYPAGADRRDAGGRGPRLPARRRARHGAPRRGGAAPVGRGGARRARSAGSRPRCGPADEHPVGQRLAPGARAPGRLRDRRGAGAELRRAAPRHRGAAPRHGRRRARPDPLGAQARRPRRSGTGGARRETRRGRHRHGQGRPLPGRSAVGAACRARGGLPSRRGRGQRAPRRRPHALRAPPRRAAGGSAARLRPGAAGRRRC